MSEATASGAIVEKNPFRLSQTVAVQAMIFGLILIFGLTIAPAAIWQGTQSLHIALEFIAALLALVVALGGIVRYIALGERLVLLFGLSFLGAGLTDLLNASISLDVIATGGGTDPTTWTAGRLTHGVLLLASLVVGQYAPKAKRINAELIIALILTIIITAITTTTLSAYSSEEVSTTLPTIRVIAGWTLITFFLWSAWGYLQLHVKSRSAFLDWAAGALVIFGVSQMYAALFADWSESTVFIPRVLKVFGYVVALTGLYMENLSLFKETERQRDELDVQNQNLERTNTQLGTLLDVSHQIAETREVDPLPQLILDNAANLMPQTETGIMFLYDSSTEVLVPKAVRGFDFALIGPMRIKPEESIFGRVYSTGEPYICRSSQALSGELDKLRSGNKTWLAKASEGKPTAHEAVCAPLMDHGEMIGVLLLTNYTKGAPLTENQISFFQTMCNQVAGAFRNAQLYKEVREYANQLRNKNQELSSFVYSASHDLRSPLVSLHGLMAMFTKSIGPKLDDRGRRYITRLEANVSQMEELIDGLLELSRIGREEVKMSEVDLNKTLREISEQLRPQLEANNIELDIHPLPMIVAPQVHIRQIYSNLLSNAVKFMGDSEVRRIEVGGSEVGGVVHLYVQDSGIGIDEAYHEKVFVIFQRLKELDEVKGTGVGLAIVKKIIDNLSGTIVVESEKGKGSRFLITLPVRDMAEFAVDDGVVKPQAE